jgi:hypothetical protein
MSEVRMDYLTDVEKKQFEDMELSCSTDLSRDADDVHKDAVRKFFIEAAVLYVEIKNRAKLEELTVEERAYLGEKEIPRSTIVFMCGILTKFLR